MSSEMFDVLRQVMAGKSLSREQAIRTFEQIIGAEVPAPAVGAFLGAMAVKGETAEELAGAADAMRERSVRITCDRDCIDTCGTGGDGISTFNVSTTAAIIAAAAGATVAKHGNRSTSRASGSTEALAQLGVNVEADTSDVERSLRENRIAYLNAQLLHPAMKRVAPVRQAIGVRTMFNLLGPLTNPAGAKRQVIGVPRPDLMETVARASDALGARHVWVVHGGDGLCDVTVTTTTSVWELRDGVHKQFTVSPEEVGLKRGTLDDLRVDSAQESAAVILDILDGKQGAPRDHALMNAGAALQVAGRATDLLEGVTMATAAVDSGAARDTLSRWRKV